MASVRRDAKPTYISKAKGGEYMPRISFEVTPEVFARAGRLLPYGVRKQVLTVLIDQLLDLIEQHGYIVCSAIVQREVSAAELLGAKEKHGQK